MGAKRRRIEAGVKAKAALAVARRDTRLSRRPVRDNPYRKTM